MPKKTFRQTWRGFLGVCVAVVLVTLAYWGGLIDPSLESRPVSHETIRSPLDVTITEVPSSPADTKAARTLPREAKVARVVDGDTLKLESGERVRLIGVDTPETVRPDHPVEFFGKEASRFTRENLEGETIRLGYDQANAATDHRDPYDRLLAYVYRSRDGLDFNAELLRQGYARAYTRHPFKRSDEFRRYEREARKNRRGLWASEGD